MKKFVIPLVTAIIVAILIFAGCAKPAPAPAPAPTPAEELRVKDLPEYQELIAKGTIDPNLLINPWGENFAVKPDGTPYTIAATYVLLRIDTCAQTEKMLTSYVERAGAKYIGFNADMDVQKQIGFIEDLIAVRHPDAIMIHAVNEAALGPVIDEAWDAGIPTINIDIECYAANRVAYVHHLMQGPGGSDAIGQYFVDKAEELGYTAENPLQVLEIWNLFEMENSHLRHEGFHTPIDKSPLVTVLEGSECKATDELAAAIVMDNFTAHPELSGLYVQGGGGAGAVEGLAAVDRLVPRDDPNHVLVALNDVDTHVVEEIDAGRVDATGSHGLSDLADVGFHVTLNYLVLGLSPPQMDIVVPMYAVSADNIDTLQICGVPVYPRLPTSRWDIWPPCDPSPTGSLQLEPGHIPWELEIPTLAKRMELMGY